MPVSDSIFYYGDEAGVHELNLNTGQRSPLLEGLQGLWLHQDRRGNYWATSAGLYHLASGKASLALECCDMRVERIYESLDGYFWLSTFNGLIRWKPFGE